VSTAFYEFCLIAELWLVVANQQNAGTVTFTAVAD
jgi:hypothetical protein